MKRKKFFRLILVLFALYGLNMHSAHGQVPASHWPDPVTGSGNMNLVAAIKIDGELQTSSMIELATFGTSDGRCRGSEFVADYGEPYGYSVFLSVAGITEGEEIYYRVYDHSTGKEYTCDLPYTVYEDNAVYGFDAPVVTNASLATSSGIVDVSQAKVLKARMQNGKLHIDGLTAGKPWSVYGVSGAPVCHGKASSDEASVSLPAQGVYIVVSGNQRVKVIQLN
ncbi:MAG: hypothetical protein LBP72_00305 [Dysgonamonadaceae bacterium]|jgi:hypothetical protein|nr:hypothetical protein [Dysgonamonadaceae bacterium]